MNAKTSHTLMENFLSLNHIVAAVDWRSWLILEAFWLGWGLKNMCLVG